jgi:hypothetical protein
MKKIITLLSILLFIMSVLKSYGQSKPVDFHKVFKSFDDNFIHEIRYDNSADVLAEIRTSCTGEITSVSILEGDTTRFGKYILESLKKIKKTDRQLKRQILFVHFVFSNESVVYDESKRKANYYRISERIKSLTESGDRIFLGTVVFNSNLEERRRY